MKPTHLVAAIATLSACSLISPAAWGQTRNTSHGLWLWKTPAVLADSRSAEAVRDFCRAQGINEVYVSFSHAGAKDDSAALDAHLANLIRVLQTAGVRVEALLSSTDADEPGPHRQKLLDHVREVVEFDETHGSDRFDGLHLDIEPQQRPENKGPGNLNFVSNLVDAFHEVRGIAEPAGLTVNADIQNKLLKGDAAERRMLLSSVPRLTLMLYELSSSNDGKTREEHEQKLRDESERYLQMAYDGLGERGLARIAIGLRTPDYGDEMPDMLQALDVSLGADPHYLGWAWHSWNDHGGEAGN